MPYDTLDQNEQNAVALAKIEGRLLWHLSLGYMTQSDMEFYYDVLKDVAPDSLFVMELKKQLKIN